MQTNIILFLLFSIIVVAIFHFIPLTWKKYYLLCVNFLFYFLCDSKFGILIITGILWSYYYGTKIVISNVHRKIFLFVGIIPLIAILAFFKYYLFFIPPDSLSLTVLMPLGISYYTFKMISYLADLYLLRRTPEPSFVNYAIYVSFFPQIICGPIVRSDEMTRILKKDLLLNKPLFHSGLLLIISGVFKKIVIADRLSTYVNSVFANPIAYPALALWMAAFFYTIQIYCDFAGYSEIAIGISNLFGFECKKNFNLPYFSVNIKEFWKRWHISLSSWLQDYIYIPLGGNRKGILRQKVNILITFFISGLWHGSGLNFIFWGLWHGILNLFPTGKTNNKWGRFWKTLATFFCVMFGWILFKADSVQSAFIYIIYMFKNLSINLNIIVASVMPFTSDYSCFAHLLTVCLFILILFIYERKKYLHPCKEYPVLYFIFAISVLFFGAIGQNSFLYANF